MTTIPEIFDSPGAREWWMSLPPETQAAFAGPRTPCGQGLPSMAVGTIAAAAMPCGGGPPRDPRLALIQQACRSNVDGQGCPMASHPRCCGSDWCDQYTVAEYRQRVEDYLAGKPGCPRWTDGR